MTKKTRGKSYWRKGEKYLHGVCVFVVSVLLHICIHHDFFWASYMSDYPYLISSLSLSLSIFVSLPLSISFHLILSFSFFLHYSYTGHMRFIGEIYMYGLIGVSKMKYCIEALITSPEVNPLFLSCSIFIIFRMYFFLPCFLFLRLTVCVCVCPLSLLPSL